MCTKCIIFETKDEKKNVRINSHFALCSEGITVYNEKNTAESRMNDEGRRWRIHCFDSMKE